MNKAQRIVILITGIVLSIAILWTYLPADLQGYYSAFEDPTRATCVIGLSVLILGAAFFFFFWKRENNK